MMGEDSIFAVDPGASGAIVYGVNPQSKIEEEDIFHLPNLGDPEVSADIWCLSSISHIFVRKIYIEDVHCRPGNGVRRNESFSYGIGRLHACLEVWNYKAEWIFVRPQVWQSDLSCLTKGNKNVTKRLAQEIFPHIKVTHRNADALLIYHWAREVYEK
jgi:hypothetical protein